tara:strand:- start:27936 stop:30254 length:2319 start_codon:yes stop_codon:yes gene_type:complete
MSPSTIPESPTSVPTPQPVPLGRELTAARERLHQQRSRARTGIWIETIGVVALLSVAYAVPTFLTDRFLRLEWIFRAVLLASFVFVVARIVRRRLMTALVVKLSDEEMALAVERKSPELEQVLISSLQFDGELGVESKSIESQQMKAAVVSSVRDRLQSIPFARAIDAGRVRKFALGIFTMFVFFIGWAGIDSESLGIWASRNVLLTNADWPRYTSLTFVDGSEEVRLPQGDALTVRVAVDGPMPEQLFMDYLFADGETGSEPMSLTGDTEFTWTIDAVLNDVKLSVQGGDSLPIELVIKIVERPRVDGLAVRVTLPEYMERESYDVPPTEGELRLPKGAKLTLTATSQKQLTSAFLLFGNDAKVAMTLGEDKQSFAGDFYPKLSGLLIIDVIDSDSLGAGTPPKLLLRVGEDKTPTIDIRLRGISSSITAQARIPGLLKVRDDFGIREIVATMRATKEENRDRGPDDTPLPPEPWSDAKPIFDQQLVPSSLKYEAEANVDLKTWNTINTPNSPDNPIQPGMLFSLRYAAKDNFGPGDPHEGFSETMTFRVVTNDKLIEELRRRQIEQRTELQAIADQEATAVLELTETVNPKDAGDQAKLAQARFKAMARRQQAMGRRVRFVSEAYQRILWEFENNRLIEPTKVRQMEALIPAPLEVLAREAFPETARDVDRFLRTNDEAVRAKAIKGYRDIMARLATILKEMEQAEDLAALIEQLRNVINLESEAIRDVKKRLEDLENNLFNQKDDKSTKPSESVPPKKIEQPDTPKKPN